MGKVPKRKASKKGSEGLRKLRRFFLRGSMSGDGRDHGDPLDSGRHLAGFEQTGVRDVDDMGEFMEGPKNDQSISPLYRGQSKAPEQQPKDKGVTDIRTGMANASNWLRKQRREAAKLKTPEEMERLAGIIEQRTDGRKFDGTEITGRLWEQRNDLITDLRAMAKGRRKDAADADVQNKVSAARQKFDAETAAEMASWQRGARLKVPSGKVSIEAIGEAAKDRIGAPENREWTEIVKQVAKSRYAIFDPNTGAVRPSKVTEVSEALQRQARDLQDKADKESKTDPLAAVGTRREAARYAAAASALLELRRSYNEGVKKAIDTDIETVTKRVQAGIRGFSKLNKDKPGAVDAHRLDQLDDLLDEANQRADEIEETLQKVEKSHFGGGGLSSAEKANFETALKNARDEIARLEKTRSYTSGIVREKKDKAEQDAKTKRTEADKQARDEGRRADTLAEALALEKKFKRNGDADALRNIAQTKKALAKKSAFQGDLSRTKEDVKRLKKLVNEARTDETRERYRAALEDAEDRANAMEQALKEASEAGDYGALDASDYEPGVWAKTRTRFRLFGQSLSDAKDDFNTKVVKKVKNHELVSRTSEEVSGLGKVFGYTTLWGLQAKRYRRQEEKGLEAQRRAKSGAWNWWYTFSNPVKRVVMMAMLLAPVMVPWGIFQFAGWMTFGLFAFIVNAFYFGIINVVNVLFFTFVSIVNVAGSTIKGAIDWIAESILSQIGQCGSPAVMQANPGAACVYHPLALHFDVNQLQVTPLLDPRLFFPTEFASNSVLSQLLDLASHLPWHWIAISIALAAIAIPFFFMQDADLSLRIIVATIIAALAVPAVIAGLGGTTDIYEQLALAFRTGSHNTVIVPAENLAKAALDFMLKTTPGSVPAS